MRFRGSLALALAMATLPALGQTKDGKSNAVEVKRVPPAKPASKEPVPNPDKYPFGDLIQTLGSEPTPAFATAPLRR